MDKNKTEPNVVKMVITVSGIPCNINNCTMIDNEYYKIGSVDLKDSGDCYLLEKPDTYIKATSNLIIYDYAINKYIYVNNKSFQKGAVGINKNGSLIIGHFSYKRLYLLPVVVYRNSKKLFCVNEEIFNNQYYYRENIADGIYYPINKIKAITFNTKVVCSYDEKKKLSYSVDSELIHSNKISFNEGFDGKLSSLVKKNGGFVDKYTFGLEFETTKGFIPNRLCRKLGLIPLRDGSISGLEYVTIPMQGKIGLEAVMQSVKELEKRTEYENDCSLHLHVGNIPRTEKYFLALYKLIFLLQDEMYSMFPIYKKDNRGLKKKHYTKPIKFTDALINMDNVINDDNLSANFKHLFHYLSMGRNYDEYNCNLSNVKSHPSDPNGTSKWNIGSRYHWFNMIPLLFGNKETVEFRVHTATDDYRKVFMFMNICISIVRFAEQHQDNILQNYSSYKNYNLYDIVCNINDDENSLLQPYIYDYIRQRKRFINEYLKQNVIFPNDNDYYFSSLSKLGNKNEKHNPVSNYINSLYNSTNVIFTHNG